MKTLFVLSIALLTSTLAYASYYGITGETAALVDPLVQQCQSNCGVDVECMKQCNAKRIAELRAVRGF